MSIYSSIPAKPVLLHALLMVQLGLRSRGMLWISLFGVACLALSFLGAAFSLRQPMVVALDLGISSLRFLGALLAIAWVQDAFVKDLERKTIVMPFVWPCTRGSYVLGRFLGVVALLAAAIAIWSFVLLLLTSVSGWGYADSSRPHWGWPYVLTTVGIFLEAVVIVSFVQMVSSVIVSPFMPMLAGIGFAVGGRILGPMIDYLAFSDESDPNLKQTYLPILQAIRWIFPELSRLDWREAVLYGNSLPWDVLASSVAMAMGYSILFVGLSTLAYRRKEIA